MKLFETEQFAFNALKSYLTAGDYACNFSSNFTTIANVMKYLDSNESVFGPVVRNFDNHDGDWNFHFKMFTSLDMIKQQRIARKALQALVCKEHRDILYLAFYESPGKFTNELRKSCYFKIGEFNYVDLTACVCYVANLKPTELEKEYKENKKKFSEHLMQAKSSFSEASRHYFAAFKKEKESREKV